MREVRWEGVCERTEGVSERCQGDSAEVPWAAGLLTASGCRTGEMGARCGGWVFLMRWSSSGHSCLEGEGERDRHYPWTLG